MLILTITFIMLTIFSVGAMLINCITAITLNRWNGEE